MVVLGWVSPMSRRTVDSVIGPNGPPTAVDLAIADMQERQRESGSARVVHVGLTSIEEA